MANLLLAVGLYGAMALLRIVLWLRHPAGWA